MKLSARELLDRYGPALAALALLALLVLLLPSNVKDAEVSTGPGGGAFPGGPVGGATGTETDAASSDATGAATSGGDASTGPGNSTATPGQVGGGNTAPGGNVTGNGSNPLAGTTCRQDGRMPGFSFYMPRCVPIFRGDNGGNTAPGVTRDKIRLVRYYPRTTAATQAALEAIGADDPRQVQLRVDQALVRYYETHYETYGRDVELIPFESNAESDDDAALRADAVKIAAMKPFGVINATVVVAEELAARGILCACSGFTDSRSYYKRTSPYVWGSLPQWEEYYQHLAEYIGKRLANRPAKWAGELPVGMREAKRKFGLIFQESTGERVNPRSREAMRLFQQELARYGVKLSRIVAYSYDLARGQEISTNVIAQMKAAGVSNVACMCEPLTPIFFTKEATRQQFFPEWLITGTLLMDTTFFGRTYDQAQWRHAFGISPLWVFWTDVRTSGGYKAYHHARPQDAHGEEGVQINVRNAPMQLIFAGIHNAGPALNVRAFEQGMYRSGRNGGIPKAPLAYFTPESHSSVKDFTEVWWNPSGRGLDETGKNGVGTLMKANGGRRYEAGKWPRSEPNVFSQAGAVYTSDTPGETFPHDADGHTHKERCRSCR